MDLGYNEEGCICIFLVRCKMLLSLKHQTRLKINHFLLKHAMMHTHLQRNQHKTYCNSPNITEVQILP